MTLDEFRATIGSTVPAGLPPLLTAMWHDAHGDWDQAHRLAQDVNSTDGAWVHAYLHRREGDADNARYWYQRAGRPEASDTSEAEWTRIVQHLLD
jgi:hypothetical protein